MIFIFVVYMIFKLTLEKFHAYISVILKPQLLSQIPHRFHHNMSFNFMTYVFV